MPSSPTYTAPRPSVNTQNLTRTIIIYSAAKSAQQAREREAAALKKQEAELTELQSQIGTIEPELLNTCLSQAKEYASASEAVTQEGTPGFFDRWPFSDTSSERADAIKATIQQCSDANLLNPIDRQGNPIAAADGVFYKPLVDFQCDMNDICMPAAARKAAPDINSR